MLLSIDMAKIFAVVNQKGGVGKTTTVVNLGAALASFYRQKVLLVDLDGQANLTISLGVPIDGSLPTIYEVLKGEKTINQIIRQRKPLYLAPANLSMTAIDVEANLKNANSAFYVGAEFQHLLDFKTNDIARERYDRLTNSRDHYYSYLYGAAIISELQAQWLSSGYDLKYRPEIIATLFNIGFNNSKPKMNSIVGGSSL